MEKADLIYDWAAAGPDRFSVPGPVSVNDQTLRDGLQSPSVSDPTIETKIEILHLMEAVGIDSLEVGLPGAGPRQYEAAERLCREIADQRLAIRPTCSGRTLESDVRPMVEISQRTGVPIEAGLFIGASAIRQYAEGWDLERMVEHSRTAIRFAVRQGLQVMFVTEDTTRSAPERLRTLMTAALDEGAHRLCLSDTVGSAVPEGVRNLVGWVRGLLDELGARVAIDWHGHRDRGLGVGNTLAAIHAGATRVHGTALGIGERIGNTAMEQILVNLNLLGIGRYDLGHLQTYVETVARALGWSVPVNAPVVGRDAFRTATGVHAAAVIKALRKESDAWLADLVYSGVPASWLGRRQQIEISHMSGASNVEFFLESRGLPCRGEIVQAVLARAKASACVLREDEILAVVTSFTS